MARVFQPSVFQANVFQIGPTALAGAVTGQSSLGSATLTTSIRPVGSSAGVSATTGALTTSIRPVGAVTAQSAAAGALTTAIRLAGTSTAVSALGAPGLDTSIRLSGGVAAGSTFLTAALDTQIVLLGSFDGASKVTGDLTATYHIRRRDNIRHWVVLGDQRFDQGMGLRDSGPAPVVAVAARSARGFVARSSHISADARFTGQRIGAEVPVVPVAPRSSRGFISRGTRTSADQRMGIAMGRRIPDEV